MFQTCAIKMKFQWNADINEVRERNKYYIPFKSGIDTVGLDVEEIDGLTDGFKMGTKVEVSQVAVGSLVDGLDVGLVDGLVICLVVDLVEPKENQANNINFDQFPIP
jgi:hypothetical protein